MASYERLDIEPFGRHLITSGDLDPVYIALAGALKERPNTLKRWLVAYWCTYNCGVSSFLSEASGRYFWKTLETIAANEKLSPLGLRWERGKERRHWRGKAALDCVTDLKGKYTDPEDMVDFILAAAPSYKGVTERVKQHVLFGPWIAFKAADMIERVLGTHIDFTTNDVFMFKDPAMAAQMLWELRKVDEKQVGVDAWAVQYLIETFKDLKAPPHYDRSIQLQEVETVLCKWKSHQKGHYPLDNDIHEINNSLDNWSPHSDVAKAFRAAMPEPLKIKQKQILAGI